MLQDVAVREGSVDDAARVSELLTTLANEFIVGDFSKTGRRHLLEHFNPKQMKERLASADFSFQLAEIGERLIGVVGLRERTHLQYLFVHRAWHRAGLARRLWEQARLQSGNTSGRFTVNASIYAVPAYQRLGFVSVGPLREAEGVIFQPMEWIAAGPEPAVKQRQLLAVQVGRVAPLAVGDRQVLSGIRKTPVTGPVAVARLGLDGDEQADLSVHGGLAKAVYAYPIEHYAFWQARRRANGLPDELPYGTFGENLTIQGLLEADLFVGDVLRFPDCELRVTQPRRPCYKFAAVMADPQVVRVMVQTGYCGFYLAVDRPGHLEVGQSFDLVTGPRETRLMALFPSVRGSSGEPAA